MKSLRLNDRMLWPNHSRLIFARQWTLDLILDVDYDRVMFLCDGVSSSSAKIAPLSLRVSPTNVVEQNFVSKPVWNLTKLL